MVEIRRSNPVPNNRPPLPQQGVLGRIKPVTENQSPLKVAVYGRAKSGKTRLASTFPKPMLLIGTEDGTKSIATTRGVDFVKIRSSEELGELTEECKKRRWKSVALDTAGGLQDLILKEILGLDEIPLQKSWGLTDQGVWGVINAQCKERLDKLLALTTRAGMDVCIIAHEREYKVDGVSSDLIKPHVSVSLSPGTGTWLEGSVDYLCQTFIRDEIRREIVDGVELQTPTGRKEYCLRTGPHSIFRTGFRVPDGISLPEEIVNPSYGKMVEVIKGTYGKKVVSSTPNK